jgi:hypothetical protein
MMKYSRRFIKGNLGEKRLNGEVGRRVYIKVDTEIQIFATSKNLIFKSTKFPHQNISE